MEKKRKVDLGWLDWRLKYRFGEKMGDEVMAFVDEAKVETTVQAIVRWNKELFKRGYAELWLGPVFFTIFCSKRTWAFCVNFRISRGYPDAPIKEGGRAPFVRAGIDFGPLFFSVWWEKGRNKHTLTTKVEENA